MSDRDRQVFLQLEKVEPWQWPEAQWRSIVARARAGRSLRPNRWPNGAVCAVALSFDADHETVSLRDGDESPARISQGHYGSRRGMPRILGLLEREQITATFFYPAVSALLHEDEVRHVAALGHEIGIHSWIYEQGGSLPYEAERELTLRAAEVLDRLSGRPPVGIRTANGAFSPHTLYILRDMGLLYDSSLMADDDPYELNEDGEPTGVIELPPEFIRDDSAYFGMNQACSTRPHPVPESVEATFRAEFDGAWAEGGLFLLTLHPHIIGHRSRVPILARLIQHIKQHGPVWFATHEQVALWCRDNTAP